MDILDFGNSTYSVNLRKLTRKSRLGFGYRDIKHITIQDILIMNKHKELIKILNLWASYIYGPLLEDKKRLIQGDKNRGYGIDVANNVYKELKKIGGVEPPKEFVFMDRAAIGMGSLFMKLGVKLNWHKLFKDLIKDFDEKRILKERNKIIN